MTSSRAFPVAALDAPAFEILQVVGRILRVALTGGDPWRAYELTDELAGVLALLPKRTRRIVLGAGKPRSHGDLR